ncbi:hypothetical protein K474DRAFT_1690761 [Panus rudis PR-1116 ss-1]|nr:hypothetical protein K474DRAFT_1690761 [Panus rudis PR-1116 ss-1]
MGVAGLWDVLRPVGQVRSLTHLAVVDGFEANPQGVRGFRVGIDASIWFYHATYGREGENPELRTLFFRCARLMSTPFLPLFVFDGPKRPSIKRGKRISGKDHWMVQGMQKIIDAFGFSWRTAPGEAEAELAYLNRIGVIDAVLTDDVDTFLFGATMIVRNPSATLSGNKAHPVKNSAGKVDDNHVVTYTAKDFQQRQDIALTQGGLILIGLLRGGDYHSGINGCGVTTAHGLAKCGFGDSLVEAASTLSEDDLDAFLATWRDEIRQELRTNSRGFLGRKSPSLAKAITEEFPNLEVLFSYTKPMTSEHSSKRAKDITVDWEKEPDLGKIAGLCELYFEWGVKEIIIKRFRTVIWPPAVLRILRRSALLSDKKHADVPSTSSSSNIPSTPRKAGRQYTPAVGTPSKMIARHFSSLQLTSPSRRSHDIDSDDEEDKLIVKIHSSRTHSSTDGILEYRLEIAPARLVRLCEGGLQGLRTATETTLVDFSDDEDADEAPGTSKVKKPFPEPSSHIRVWMPASMVKIAVPDLVEEFENKQATKVAKKTKSSKKTSSAKASSKAQMLPQEEEESSDDAPLPKLGSRNKATSRVVSLPVLEEEETQMPNGGHRKISSSHMGHRREEKEESEGKPMITKKQAGKMVDARSTQSETQDKPRTTSKVVQTLDAVFKANKLAHASTRTSKTASVASLFENIPEHPPRNDAGSSKVNGGRASAKPSKAKALKQRSTKSQSQTSTAMEPSKPSILKPRPFPLMFDPSEDFFVDLSDEETFPSSSQLTSNSESPSRRRREEGSPVPDEDSGDLRKSPRKSRSYNSPRARTAGGSAKESRKPTRSPSPSPYIPSASRLPLQAKQQRFDIGEIIEISDDSDDEPVPVRKLFLDTISKTAQRKDTTSASRISTTKPTRTPPIDIIDLT